MQSLSEKELLTLQLDCLFTYEGDRMVRVNEPWGNSEPAPLLAVGQTTQGEILYRFGKYAPQAVIQKTRDLLNPLQFSTLAAELHAKRFCQESCFYFPAFATPTGDCRLLSADDKQILAATFKDCVEEIETAQPYVGFFCDGKIVSICRSVRKGNAHEAGIETLPSYRRRGYAQLVLNDWTAAVQKQGLVPLYSALSENTASIRLARKAGYVLYAHLFQVWQV